MFREQRVMATITLSCILVLQALPGTLASAQQNIPQAATAKQLSAAATCPVPSGKNFSGQNLSNHNFHSDPAGSLVGAKFSNADLTGAVFNGQDLTGASFYQAKMGASDKGPVDLSNTKLTNTCFIGATLNATDFSFAKITCADFSETSLTQARFGPLQTILAGTNCRTKFVGSTIDVKAITTDHWGQTDFTNANFQNLSPSTFDLVDKDITGAKLGNTNFTGIDMTGAKSHRRRFHADEAGQCQVGQRRAQWGEADQRKRAICIPSMRTFLRQE
jgi:uncharacterized protein YjbI with pentapeptide repeats